MTPQQLVARRDALHQLLRNTYAQLDAVEAALAAHGAPRAGPPRKPSKYTIEQAREAHRLYRQGDRSEWVVNANREYNRNVQRRRRSSVCPT